MERTLQRLTGLSVERTKTAGYTHDGGGLYLQVTDLGRKSWIFRYSHAGRRRDMGLGPYPAIGLATARKLAQNARSLAAAGMDPIAVRDAERARQRLEATRALTFDQVAERYIAIHEGGWKNKKHRQQWRNTLRTYASPVIGSARLNEISVAHVTKILAPLWNVKHETASRLRGRIEEILSWATAQEYRTGDNPARRRAVRPPKRSKESRVKHHAAVAIDDMPAVYGRLCAASGMAALAVRFTILTAARAGETTGALWSEIDLVSGVWTVPGERMKKDSEHRVPLSREALAILRALNEVRTSSRVFPGWRNGAPLAIASLAKAVKKAGGKEVTTHGCRSTFKDWASERTDFLPQVSEKALAHAIGDETEAAYRRGELMAKRTEMMQAWATFVTTEREPAKVVPFPHAPQVVAHPPARAMVAHGELGTQVSGQGGQRAHDHRRT